MATVATTTTMAMLKAKCTTPVTLRSRRPVSKPIVSNLSLHNLLKTFTSCKPLNITTTPFTACVIAGAIFVTLGSSDAAFAAQNIADIAEGDNRGLALLLPLIPAVLWVLYNILQPALNQLNRMRNEKSVIAGLGLGGGLAATGFLSTPEASAQEFMMIAESSSSDSRGLLVLFVVAPAILWVLYNILQPALNQFNRMRSE